VNLVKIDSKNSFISLVKHVSFLPPTTPAVTDYNETTVNLTFDAIISTQVVTVSILDDNVVEDTEFINLALTSVDSAVMLHPATARINIEDVDSELMNRNYIHVLTCMTKVSTILLVNCVMWAYP